MSQGKLLTPFNQRVPVVTAREGEKNGRAGIIPATSIGKGDFIAFNDMTKVGKWFKVRHIRQHRVEGRLVNIKLEGTSAVGMDAEINLSPEDRVRRIQ